MTSIKLPQIDFRIPDKSWFDVSSSGESLLDLYCLPSTYDGRTADQRAVVCLSSWNDRQQSNRINRNDSSSLHVYKRSNIFLCHDYLQCIFSIAQTQDRPTFFGTIGTLFFRTVRNRLLHLPQLYYGIIFFFLKNSIAKKMKAFLFWPHPNLHLILSIQCRRK